MGAFLNWAAFTYSDQFFKLIQVAGAQFKITGQKQNILKI